MYYRVCCSARDDEIIYRVFVFLSFLLFFLVVVFIFNEREWVCLCLGIRIVSFSGCTDGDGARGVFLRLVHKFPISNYIIILGT